MVCLSEVLAYSMESSCAVAKEYLRRCWYQNILAILETHSSFDFISLFLMLLAKKETRRQHAAVHCIALQLDRRLGNLNLLGSIQSAHGTAPFRDLEAKSSPLIIPLAAMQGRIDLPCQQAN